MKINKRKTRRIIIAEKNEMWDRKCQEINMYVGGRKCSEASKFIKKVRTSEKESVHLQMIPIDKWVQYYQKLLTESQPDYKGTKNIIPIQMDGDSGVPRNFFQGGVQQIQLRTERTGI